MVRELQYDRLDKIDGDIDGICTRSSLKDKRLLVLSSANVQQVIRKLEDDYRQCKVGSCTCLPRVAISV